MVFYTDFFYKYMRRIKIFKKKNFIFKIKILESYWNNRYCIIHTIVHLGLPLEIISYKIKIEILLYFPFQQCFETVSEHLCFSSTKTISQAAIVFSPSEFHSRISKLCQMSQTYWKLTFDSCLIFPSETYSGKYYKRFF